MAGWDRVRATMPEAEIGELIVELRSATAGAGSFTRQFDRMAEVTGRRRSDHCRAPRRRVALLMPGRKGQIMGNTDGGR